MTIGVLGAGIVGLSTIAFLRRHLPEADFIYLGDTARAPYGTKSPETVRAFALEGGRRLISEGAEAVMVVSCAIAACGGEFLAGHLSVPVMDPVAATAAAAAAANRKGAIGLLGDPLTVESGRFEAAVRAVAPRGRVYASACPLLTPLVEADRAGKPETAMIIRKYLLPLKVRQIDTLIPATAAFGPLEKAIAGKAGRRVRVVNPFLAMAAAAADHFAAGNISITGGGGIRVLLTDTAPTVLNRARFLLHRNPAIQQIHL